MHDKEQPLPSQEEVLICTPETTMEEVMFDNVPNAWAKSLFLTLMQYTTEWHLSLHCQRMKKLPIKRWPYQLQFLSRGYIFSCKILFQNCFIPFWMSTLLSSIFSKRHRFPHGYMNYLPNYTLGLHVLRSHSLWRRPNGSWAPGIVMYSG